MKRITKILLFAGIVIVVLLVAAVVLANTKSPESSKNYLSYLTFHSKSWPCQIINQRYHDEQRTNYEQECVDRICNNKYPEESSGTGKIPLFGARLSQDLCKSLPTSAKDPELKECENITTEKVADFPSFKGQQEKYYYFAIPILKESCPENYSALTGEIETIPLTIAN